MFWGIIALIFGLIVFIIPIFLPIKDDIETLRKRAEKERIKAWRKGKFNYDDEGAENDEEIEGEDDLREMELPKEKE